jgi:hypothetical protein
MRRAGIVLIALALLVTASIPTSTYAQEGSTLPPLAPHNSLRAKAVFVLNNRALFVTHAQGSGYNRVHFTFRALETFVDPDLDLELTAGDVFEVVVFDETEYVRVNEETTWMSYPNEGYDPDARLEEELFLNYISEAVGDDYTLTTVGRIDVEGTPTTQYQFYSLDESLRAQFGGGELVYDLFISDDGRVIKESNTVRGGSTASSGSIDGGYLGVYYDHNTPISVAPPPADQVQPGTMGAQSLGIARLARHLLR